MSNDKATPQTWLVELTGLDGDKCYVRNDAIVAVQAAEETDDYPPRTIVAYGLTPSGIGHLLVREGPSTIAAIARYGFAQEVSND